MSTKELASNTAKAFAWDQFFGWLDRLIFYPILAFLAVKYDWLICFIVTLPCYFIYSILIVTINFRAVSERGVDLFGIHALREAAVSTRPPVISVSGIIHHIHYHCYIVCEALIDHRFNVTRHIVVRFGEKVGKKILSWILNNKILLYVIGTLVIFDPQSVFMFTTQKCDNEHDFVGKIISKLLPMVCWHIFYWSGVACGVVSGIKYFV